MSADFIYIKITPRKSQSQFYFAPAGKNLEVKNFEI
jgi:hypothetical protein